MPNGHDMKIVTMTALVMKSGISTTRFSAEAGSREVRVVPQPVHSGVWSLFKVPQYLQNMSHPRVRQNQRISVPSGRSPRMVSAVR